MGQILVHRCGWEPKQGNQSCPPSLLLPHLPSRKIELQWTQEGQNVVEKVSLSLLLLVAIHVWLLLF